MASVSTIKPLFTLFIAIHLSAFSGTGLIPLSVVITDYTETFNKHDNELYIQSIPNAQAADVLAGSFSHSNANCESSPASYF